MTNREKSSKLAFVASSILAMLSVEGQRGLPFAVVRFDLLNVVGSRPAFLAMPEGVKPFLLASASIPVQICQCVSIKINHLDKMIVVQDGDKFPSIGI